MTDIDVNQQSHVRRKIRGTAVNALKLDDD